jgi:hypothetical protein
VGRRALPQGPLHKAFGVDKYVRRRPLTEDDRRETRETSIFNENYNISTIESRANSIFKHLEYRALY